MWGIVPAAGAGSRIQPLAFSKELLPVGSRFDDGAERPRAVSEYLIERMILGGADRICFVVAPGKSDILEYYGTRRCDAHVCYTVQPRPAGLCDAIFRALPLIPLEDFAIVGLPDTIWFPEQALQALGEDALSFLLFPVDRPERFDAVLTTPDGVVTEVRVKRTDPGTRWVWGAFKLSGRALRELHELWLERGRADEYVGTLVNAWMERGGRAVGVPAGDAYVDVGTLQGYRDAIRVLSQRPPSTASAVA
jgi:glucose-1-phosphate thymidylyltransferase